MGYQSVEGRSIDVCIVGPGPRAILIMAGVHGDEANGVEVVRLVQSRLSQMPEDRLGDLRIVFMLLINPDGYAAGTRQNANGIDINRNFPDKLFGTGEQSGQYYGGISPASEPETQAIISTVTEYNPELIISLHEPLACVNYNGPCLELAQRMSELTGLPAVGDIGYPTPGSMGNYYGLERQLPVITFELPRENVDVSFYADVLMDVLCLKD